MSRVDWEVFGDGYRELETPIGMYSILPSVEKDCWYVRFNQEDLGYCDTEKAALQDVMRSIHGKYTDLKEWVEEVRPDLLTGDCWHCDGSGGDCAVDCKHCDGTGRLDIEVKQ